MKATARSESFDAVVIGAGIGGLAAAARLATAGRSVCVLEAGDQIGGKMRTHLVGGMTIDAGPTVLTMREVIDAIFCDAGERTADHLDLQPLSILARHAWPDGSRLDLHADPDASAQAIAELASERDAEGYRRFCAYAQRLYDTAAVPFMHSAPTSFPQLMRRSSWRQLAQLARIDWHRTMWRSLGDFFTDPRLRQLFARYATYYGSSPFAAPATLNLIAHVEARGVWTVTGGMHQLATALGSLIRRHGGVIEVGQAVEEIELDPEGHTSGVRLRDGRRIRSAGVVFNGAPQALQRGDLGEALRKSVKLPRSAVRSLSAVTLAIAGRVQGWPLVRHNVLFSDDYRREFVQLFDQGRVPEAPTVYICAQDRDDDGQSPGRERLLVLVNAPARGDEAGFQVDVSACKQDTMKLLNRCGLSIESEAEVVTTPLEFARRYPATGGALYGSPTHGATAAFDRPGPRSATPGLYLVGGGVHPGAGVPMVATGGRLAANALLEDLPSTQRFRRGATSGGTSTRYPTPATTH